MVLFHRCAETDDDLPAASLAPSGHQDRDPTNAYSRALSSQSRVVAQVEIATSWGAPIPVSVFDHELLTFKVWGKDIPLLNALTLDLALNPPAQGGYESFNEKYTRLKKSHPYSSRFVDEKTFFRWEDLYFHLENRRDE